MPIYITLFNLTEQGVKNIKDAPERIEEGIKTAESIGGKLIGFYATMGEYDFSSTVSMKFSVQNIANLL